MIFCITNHAVISPGLCLNSNTDVFIHAIHRTTNLAIDSDYCLRPFYATAGWLEFNGAFNTT